MRGVRVGAQAEVWGPSELEMRNREQGWGSSGKIQLRREEKEHEKGKGA